ncbi:uncharacterized protein LOC134928760 [Pseudophryne corroboree]|uniref:uncharacterized protein LOC134928760 n=1 Tax=Pseudophryne corroboree TaxID=495146 RepID=UPI003081A461
MRDGKFPGSEPLASSLESTLTRKVMKPNERVSSRVKSTELSSPAGTQNMDNGHQKWPAKLAPLDLPAEMKEAQLKKLTDMKDEVFLDKKRHSHHHAGYSLKTSADRPVKRDPLNKVGLSEHKLPKLKDGTFPAKDKTALKDSSSTVYALPGNPRDGASSSSMLNIKSGHVHHSLPKSILMNTADSQNVSIKGRFKYSKSQNTNQSRSMPVKANGLP